VSDTTVIRNASWVIAWEGRTGRHVYLRDADVVFSGDRITHVGRASGAAADRVVDGRDRLVLPGLVNIHSHPSSEPLNKGYMEEIGSRNLYMGGYYEYASVMFVPPDDEAKVAAATVGYCELLRSGCTTVADLSYPYAGWVDLAARSGLRVWLGPMFRSGRPTTPEPSLRNSSFASHLWRAKE